MNSHPYPDNFESALLYLPKGWNWGKIVSDNVWYLESKDELIQIPSRDDESPATHLYRLIYMHQLKEGIKDGSGRPQ